MNSSTQGDSSFTVRNILLVGLGLLATAAVRSRSRRFHGPVLGNRRILQISNSNNSLLDNSRSASK